MDPNTIATSSSYSLIATLVVGLIIGFIANTIMGSGGLGIIWSIILGLIGSFIGNFLFALVGLSTFGLFGQVLAGVVGACLLIYVVRRLRRV